MAHEVRTRPLPPTAAQAEATPGPTIMDRVDAVLEGLWHFLASMRFAMVLILALAFLGLIGSLIIQAPPGVLADPTGEQKQQWLNEIGQMGVPVVTWLHGLPVIGSVVPDLRYKDVARPFDTLQLFQIFNSIYFRVVVAALVISTVACSVHRIPGMIRTATKPRIDVAPGFFEHAPQHEAIVVRRSPAETRSILEATLAGKRYRTLGVESDGAVSLYADRWRWAPFAGLVGHLSIVVILAGGIVGATMGYRESQFTIAEGATLPVAAEPGVTIQLLDFTDTYDTRTGAPSDYASTVVLYKDGTEVDRHVIRVNDPLRYGDTTFYQAFFGSAAVVTVKDATGATILSEGVPLAWRTTNDNRPIGSVSIPGTDNVAWIYGTNGAGDTSIAPGQVRMEVYNGDGASVGEALLDQGKAGTVAGLTATFERESQFTGLNIGRDPGVGLVWLGSFLLFGGFVIRFTMPHKRLWARIVPRPNGAVVGVASLGSKEVALGTEFESLVNDIRQALAAPAGS
ncbi:MAG TPA: cytochrome c biogenesis protein ResB [Candidatus Limnocylindrales bacterium]